MRFCLHNWDGEQGRLTELKSYKRLASYAAGLGPDGDATFGIRLGWVSLGTREGFFGANGNHAENDIVSGQISEMPHS